MRPRNSEANTSSPPREKQQDKLEDTIRMNVIEFIREKRENLQINNAEFIAKLEPKFRSLSDIINSKLANTLNNPWISRFSLFEDEQPKECFPEQTPEAKQAYDQLKTQLGEETFVGKWHTIDQDCINQFAAVTGDNQWIHTDPERAKKESPFKSTVAHGFLTLSLLPALTNTVDPENNPYPDARMTVNYGLNKVRFPFPVKAGTRVRAHNRLIGLTPMKKSIEVVNEMTIEIENSKRLACVAETVLRLYY
jgi:acyl dehydratase